MIQMIDNRLYYLKIQVNFFNGKRYIILRLKKNGALQLFFRRAASGEEVDLVVERERRLLPVSRAPASSTAIGRRSASSSTTAGISSGLTERVVAVPLGSAL